MLTALRAQLNAAMSACCPSRRPALRHAGCEGWLLCSDVPQLVQADALHALCAQLHANGWRTAQLKGWLYFDKPVPVPQADPQSLLPGEAGCVASLLRRHPGAAPCDEAIRTLCCAYDKGPVHVERCCRQLHSELAARLRQHQPLPGGLLPYIIRAARQKEETP